MNPLVLIIDDDPAITDMLSVLLRANGFETVLSNTGTDGLRMIREIVPRVVIVDLMMPDLDGWQLAKAAREFTSVPILILSALDEPSIVASVLDQGADDFLVNFLLKNPLAIDAKQRFAMLFVADGMDNF